MFITANSSINMRPRKDADYPTNGICRRSVAEIFDTRVATTDVSSVVTWREGIPVQHELTLGSPAGLARYVRDGEQDGTWRFGPGMPFRSEEKARQLAETVLGTLETLCAQLPETHLPPVPATPVERDLVRTELPTMDAGAAVHDHFGDLLLLMARRIAEARDLERARMEYELRTKRLRRQFALLPEGTMLVGLGRSDQVATVMDEPGSRRNRALVLRFPDEPSRRHDCFADQSMRSMFALVTPQRAPKAARVLSAHETLDAVTQARTLAEQCPDLA